MKMNEKKFTRSVDYRLAEDEFLSLSKLQSKLYFAVTRAAVIIFVY